MVIFFFCALGIIISRLYPIYFIEDTGSETYAKADSSAFIDLEEDSNRYLPVHIEIPDVGISLSVDRGSYDFSSEEWTLYDQVAFWADLTALPSDQFGNTLIYAHNKPDAFYPLKDIEPGDEILLTADTGEVLVYQYEYDLVVDPRNNDLFELNDDSYLTLLTCNGWFSEARRLMVSRLIEIRPYKEEVVAQEIE